MNDLMQQLLDLDILTWGSNQLRFGFERPIPGWGWVLVVIGAIVLAAWSYQRLSGSQIMRTLLAGSRALLLLLLAVLVAGPQLVERTETTESDWVVVLVDRSASMTIADVASDRAGGPRQTREQQLESAIRESWPMWQEISRDRTIIWLGFDAGAFEIDTRASDNSSVESINLDEPDGQRTSLGAALDQAMARVAARPLSSVVVLSDGRSLDDPSRAAMRRLQSELIPVHTVALGSADPLGDYSIRAVDAPRYAFVDDITPITVSLDRLGAVAGNGATVRLVDAATGIVLDEQRVEAGDDQGEAVTLSYRPTESASADWRVEVVSDAPDLVAENNTYDLSIDLIDRPLRVLYVDGYPRWEQRYLRNMLIREKSITASTLLLAPDRRYTQEGEVEVITIPESPEEWSEYDAVIIGDVRPDVFTVDQLYGLRDHVAMRGAGLIWIGGPGSTPRDWWTSPLADLLPFTRQATDGSTFGEPVMARPTAEAERLGILRLNEDAQEPWPWQLTDQDIGWSHLRWVQWIDEAHLKPTAELLAEAESVFGDRTVPLVLSMRYGAGRSIYVATDEIWRWRYGQGERWPERFWIQMIRLLAREGLARTGRPAILEVTPRRSLVEQPVRISLELLDQSLVDLSLPTVSVRLVRKDQPGDGDDLAGGPVELLLRREPGSVGIYSTIWLPPRAGTWVAEPADPELAGIQVSAEAEVSRRDDELRRPETDHGLLASLSDLTGGRVFEPGALRDLPDFLPRREVRNQHETAESLWDTPLALILVVLLLSWEWIGRRVIRLI